MAKSDRTIILFSLSYPYGHIEHSFLREELIHLGRNFQNVIIVPERIGDKNFALPEGVNVDTSLANALQHISFWVKIKTVFSITLILELFSLKFNFKKFRYALAAHMGALVTKDWIKKKTKETDPHKLILYSFWFDFTTIGAVMFKARSKNTKVVTRCHNFDIYGNEHNGFYVPFQGSVLRKIDVVYPDSFQGKEFILENFPEVNCKEGIMGVPEPEGTNLMSVNGKIHIVSCAYMIPRKRVGLLLDALVYLTTKRPDLDIEWTHVGEGPQWDDLVSKKNKYLGHINVNFTGNINNDELREFYNTKPVDLFVNTSTKEGTPVAIIEAISYGIPILATAFGGNKEIVERGAGVLLSQDPTAQEIGDKIEKLIDSNELSALRLGSKSVWENHYNSAKNYHEFCNDLREL